MSTKHTTISGKLLLNPIHFLSFGLGSGLSPIMPGTMGSLVGFIIALFIPALAWHTYLIAMTVAVLVGIYSCDITAKALNIGDHPAIVLDEIVGVLIVLLLLPKQGLWLLIGFILFRFFDIIKPWPIAVVDRRFNNGFGIMLDDIIAAIFSVIIIKTVMYLI